MRQVGFNQDKSHPAKEQTTRGPFDNVIPLSSVIFRKYILHILRGIRRNQSLQDIINTLNSLIFKVTCFSLFLCIVEKGQISKRKPSPPARRKVDKNEALKALRKSRNSRLKSKTQVQSPTLFQLSNFSSLLSQVLSIYIHGLV